MATLEGSAYQRYMQQQAENPAAPEGQQQIATEAAGADPLAGTAYGEYSQQAGYVPIAQQWYTGANQEGTSNGWDNQFVEDFIDGQNKAAANGTLNTYFDKANATGVVTWDHESQDGGRSFHFGDVYQGGEFQGNLYDQFDKPTADLMMADWLFDGKTKAEIYSASDNVERLAREVEAKHEQNNTEIPQALAAQAFAEDVSAQAADYRAGAGDDLIAGGGALGGAALGAAGGAVVAGPVGAVVGGVGGALIGGVGAFLNKDALTEQAARADLITDMSFDEHGTVGGFFTGVEQWSGFAGKAISPLSNLTQGVIDASAGEVGDGQSEFYRVKQNGDSAVPTWLKSVDVVATIGDAALQFATPIGAALYTTQMTGVIGGEVGALATSGGETFDYSRGGFDNIFTDEQGNFDASAGAAGIGKIGIDAVQLGMARGLMGKADAALTATGKEAVYKTPLLGRFFGGGEKTLVGQGSGFKFYRDAEGNLTKRASLSLLAPSEQLSALSARLIGRRSAAMKEAGTYSTDDFYKAVTALATGERRWKTALVNGMGEGYEEAVQAVFEPHSHGHAFSAADLGTAAVYGFAAGVGMGAGIGVRSPSLDAKLFAQAQIGRAFQSDGAELTQAEWKAMSDTERRNLASLGALEAETARAAYRKIADSQRADQTAGVVGVTRFVDAVNTKMQTENDSRTARTDGAFTIIPIESSAMPSDAVASSMNQLLANHVARMRGISIQAQTLAREAKELTDLVAAEPDNSEAAAELAKVNKTRKRIDLMLKWGKVVDDILTERNDRTGPGNDLAVVAAEVEATNRFLQDAFNSRVRGLGDTVLSKEEQRALAQVVSHTFTRDPQDHSGSYPILLPQVSLQLTTSQSDNVLQISLATLPAIRGDFDGDKIRPLNQAILDDEAFIAARAGEYFIGAGASVNLGPAKYEKYLFEQVAAALESTNPALRNQADGMLVDIGRQIRDRYDGVVEADVIDEVLKEFFDAAEANDPSARKKLLDGLAREAGAQIKAFSRTNLSNEWMWIDHLVRTHIDVFQEALAAHDFGQFDAPNTDVVAVNKQSQRVQTVRGVAAAEMGTTLGQKTPGDSMYRKFTQLHFSSVSAPVRSAEEAQTEDTLIYEFAQLYEALGNGLTRQQLDEIRGKDEIANRVAAILLEMSRRAVQSNPQLNAFEAMTVLANLQVPDYRRVDDRVERTNKTVTLAQILLRESVQRDQRDKRDIVDASPELQAKYRRLLAMTFPPTQGKDESSPVNAERAFVEVFGSQQLFTLLGAEADVFGPHLTVEQFLRGYIALSPEDRKVTDEKLKDEAPYLGREKTHNIPYDLNEVGDQKVSAFRSVVDSIIAVGHDSITMNEDGALKGDFARRDRAVSKTFRDALALIRQAVLDYGNFNREPGELTGDLVKRMVNENPTFGRRLMELVPKSVANAVFRYDQSTDTVYISNWFYETFTMEPKKAEMHFWRNMLMAKWRAAGFQDIASEDTEEGEKGRRFSDLDSRMLRVMWMLEANDPSGVTMTKFLNKLESEDDLDKFFAWVNTHPEIRGNQPPLLPYFDDTADFDADKAGGGWTTVLKGTEMRKAISSLQTETASLLKDIASERASYKADRAILGRIQQHARFLAGDPSESRDVENEKLYNQLQRRIDEAGETWTALGPEQMLYQMLGAVRGWYPQAHKKGENPEHVDVQGSFDAFRDAFGYSSMFERTIASLHAYNLDDVGSNLNMVVRDGGRTMDDYGRTVEWGKPTVEEVVAMLLSPDKRAQARAELFPQVMERDYDGAMRPKLLIGKDLRGLLNGESFREMYPGQSERFSTAGAQKLLSAVEAEARKFGGHASVQRALNELTIAFTSAATSSAGTSEADVLEAIRTFATILEMTASVAAATESNPDDTRLADLKAQLLKTFRDKRMGASLGIIDKENLEYLEFVKEALATSKRTEINLAKATNLREFNERGVNTEAERDRLDATNDRLDSELAQFEERIGTLVESDYVGHVVQMFSFPANDPDSGVTKTAIVDFINSNPDIMETRATSSIVLQKLQRQLRDPALMGQPKLTTEEWDELSRSAIAVYIDRSVSTSGANIAVPAYPDADHADDRRLYDLHFGYLLDHLFDKNDPVLRGAMELHKRAGRHDRVAPDEDITAAVMGSIFKEGKLGEWTTDIPRATLDSFGRLDSAAAEQVIKMIGNSPKRQAAFSRATRRTFRIPGDELLSTVDLSYADLSNPVEDFDEIAVTLPSGQATVPMVQLNNRFAKSVSATYVDADGNPQTVNLFDVDPNLGHMFPDATAAASGMQSVHLSRIKRAVEKAAIQLNISPSSLAVQMKFFHPDSQPVDLDANGQDSWMNNLFFEGTNFLFDADRFDSLNEGLWFSFGGLNPEGQAAALEANKLGLPSLEVAPQPTAGQRALIEEYWRVDFAGMLRAKTQLIMKSKLSSNGPLDINYYNSVYKNVKMRNFVIGKLDGETAVWTAEQVIAFQRDNPGEALPLSEPKLWTPSDDVLRSMLGENGDQGVRRVLGADLEFDLSAVKTYRGVTPEMLAQFEAGFSGQQVELSDTRVSHLARQSQLVVAGRPVTRDELSAYQLKMKRFDAIRGDIYAERQFLPNRGDGSFNTQANLQQALTRAEGMIRAEDISMDWARGSVSYVGPREAVDSTISLMAMHEIESVIAPNSNKTGWIYRENGQSIPNQGLLSPQSLSGKQRKGLEVAPDDIVVLELDSFPDYETLKKRIDYFMDRGAVIILGSIDGATHLRAEADGYLMESSGYERIHGSKHAYQPADLSKRYQNQRARVSSLLETGPISTRNMLMNLLLPDRRVEENALLVNFDDPHLQSVAVSLDLLPVDAFGGFNVPVSWFDVDNQVEDVRRRVLAMDTPEHRQFLRDMSSGSDGDFEAAFDRMISRLQRNASLLPEPGDQFGTGDMIPLVDNTGNILIYRHGHRAPQRKDIEAMTAIAAPGSFDAGRVAIYSSERDPQATTHTGEVVSVDPRSGYGLSIELDIPLQFFGNKVQLEFNGMKYLLTPMPDDITLPAHGIFPNWNLNGIGSIFDAMSKESTGGFLNNHRTAFSVFGIDFLPDVAKFFNVSPEDARQILHGITKHARRISYAEADALLRVDQMSDTALQLVASFVTESQIPGTDQIVDQLEDVSSVEGEITKAIVIYLMTRGARPEHVLQSGGFNDTSADINAQSRLMPRLFTGVFDRAPIGSPLRSEINRRLNAQINNPATDGTGYLLTETWDFVIKNADPAKTLVGMLQVAEAHAAGDNPIKNGMAFDPAESSKFSPHSAAIMQQSTGASTAYVKDSATAQRFMLGEGIEWFDRDNADGGVWRLLRDINRRDVSAGVAFRTRTPAEVMRQRNARDAVTEFRQKFNLDDESLFTTEQKRDYEEWRRKIAHRLHLDGDQAFLVDFWVRQMIGAPQSYDHDGRINGKDAVEVAKDIWWNVENNYIPVAGAEVPLLHASDLQLLFRQNKGAGGWRLRAGLKDRNDFVEGWDQWVRVALGTAKTADTTFDPLYLLALDGFMHTYQNATRSLIDLPVSFDTLVSLKLLDEKTNRFIVSLERNTDLLAKDPLIVESMQTTLDELVGGKRISGKFEGKAAPASTIAKRRAARRKWRRETDTPLPVDASLKNFLKNGYEFETNASNTNALSRMAINLRVGTALLNPALYVSMGPEQWIRGTLDRAANLLTGQSTAGITGRAAARIGLSEFTPEQLQKLNRLYKNLGNRTDFRAEIYRTLMFLRPHAPGIGRMEKWLESYAKVGARAQDPTWGMSARTMARRYLEAAIMSMQAAPTLYPITVDQLVAEMSTDPLFLQKNMPEIHKQASNALAQIRSLKDTPISLVLRGIYEPMSESSNAAVNMFGNLVLKLPLLFSNYAANVFITITGMQGVFDMIAAFTHGRNKWSLIGRAQAAMRGEDFDPEEDHKFDMSSVIEGIDLTRSFIRGGLTHTGLFMFGLAAGGLGLSGEDDETKKRRKMAALQGAGFVYDPRLLENDFRNQDAIFLDWLPFGLSSYFRVVDSTSPGGERSMGQLNWTLRQFISPIIGMERFFETGDFRQVTWGFQDAIGAFPLINTLMWDDAVQTAHELSTMADREQKLGNNDNLANSAWFLTNAVGVYERMLFENSFVNQLYVGFDRYDRDPYALPLKDSDGTLQRDIEGNVRPQNIAMEPHIYIDPESGEKMIGTNYQARDTTSATLHALTENRATLAFAANMFTGLFGGEADFSRYQMPEKLRSFDKPAVSRDEAEAIVRALSQGTGGQPSFTADEISAKIKNDNAQSGNYVPYTEVDKYAQQVFEKSIQDGTNLAVMSVLDKDGYEVLTEQGAKGVFQGLAKGSVKLGDKSLAGIYIPYEMRVKIQKEWMRDIIQEGVDYGLDQSKATSRMKRLWYGPLDSPDVLGLGDILWSKDISYDKSIQYKQLNTTYVTGPDGKPWATGFTRGRVMAALGIQPIKRAYTSEQAATSTDSRLNTTDLVNNINTGLRALELVDKTSYVPTDVEIGKSIEDAIAEAANQTYTPQNPYSSSGSGYGGYGGYGGGGYSSSASSYFNRVYALPGGTTPYANTVPFINTTNPLIRRADIRRERVWSERGRLKQWQ